MKNNQDDSLHWYRSVYKGFLISSVLVFLMSFGFTGETNFNATVTGYGLLIISISLIMIVIVYGVAKNTQSISAGGAILNVLANVGPFICMLFMLCVIFSILITYKNEIISENVSTGFSSFSNISLALFMVQLYIVYNAFDTDKFKTTGKIPRITSGLVYLLDILEGVCAIIMFTILKYFTTDG